MDRNILFTSSSTSIELQWRPAFAGRQALRSTVFSLVIIYQSEEKLSASFCALCLCGSNNQNRCMHISHLF
jgi:hypothetical protein